MGDLFSNAITGVVTYQRSLATVGHNIANASTAGYSRQSVEIVARLPTPSGSNFVGSGSQISDVRRHYDTFLTDQIRRTTSELSRLDTLHQFSSMVDDILGDPQGGISPSLQSFFSAIQDLANDPDSATTRTVALARAEELVGRFDALGQRLDGEALSVNDAIGARVDEINDLSSSLARINDAIVGGQASRSGVVAPDVLDRQEELLRQLAERVSVTTLRRDNNTLDVYAGTGQVLVGAGTAYQLQAIADPQDGTRSGVGYLSAGGTTVDITRSLTGGELGGLLDFRREVLDQAINGLGRVALGIADGVNLQHRRGMDQSGVLGGDFFSMSAPQVVVNANNSGTASVTASVTDAGLLTTQDYRLSFDGGNFTLASLDGASSVTGIGPTVSLDGMVLSIGVGAVSGDSFLIRPTRGAARGLDLAIRQIGEIAAAAPVRASVDLGNAGTARISAGEVTDSTNISLLNPVLIEFTAPGVYNRTDTVTGAQAVGLTLGNGVVSGNGWRAEISGAPATGDRFFVDPNRDGFTDNRNAVALAGLVDSAQLANRSATFQEAYSAVVGVAGAHTRQAEVNRDVQSALLGAASDRRESISGVNLDEEAARLVQLQQAYQASARMLATSSELFESLLATL